MMESTRTANFSSSSIWKLTKRNLKGEFLKPALTYIDEKRMEKKLGRALNLEVSSRPTSWGNLVEKRAFDVLPIDYKLLSKERISHKEISNWTAAIDVLSNDAIGDIKCPYTLKSFCEIVDTNGEIFLLQEVCPEYYWQIVSNAILSDMNYGELILYVPYKSELSIIKSMVDEYEGDADEVSWIKYQKDSQLPYLIEGGHYKNLNILRFEIPQGDKIFLTESVQKAVELLNK